MFLKKQIKLFLPLIAILFITYLSFLPSIKSGFINWDDNEYVTENPDIRSLSFDNIKKINSSFYVGCYLPVTMLSYSIEYHYYKLDPHIYHSVNLILHLINCILVYWLFVLLCRNKFIAFAVTLLFGIHPLHVESVAWISERKDLLYSLFFILSLISYIYYRQSEKRSGKILKYYFLSVLFFLFSLFSKPMAVSLPIILLLIDYLFHTPLKVKIFTEKIPFFLLSLIFGIVAILGQQAAGATSSKSTFALADNFLIACHGIILYIYKLIIPINLSAIYPYPQSIMSSCIFSPFILLIIIVGIIFSLKYTRKILFGFLFFLITILPVLKIVPIGYAMIADRYTYIPYLGIFYIISVFGFWLYKRNKILRHLLIISFIAISILFGYMTWLRCYVWKDAISLWSDIIKKCENVPPVAYNNRGEIYRTMRQPGKAIDDFTKAIAIDTNYSSAYLNRGTVYHELGDTAKAIKDYHKALKAAPNLQQAYNNLGNLYLNRGDLNSAISNYNCALTIMPTFPESYNGRGLAYARLGFPEKAISNYSSAITFNPYHDKAYGNRGLIYQSLGNHEKAILDFTMAIDVNPFFAEAYHHLAISLFQLGKYEDAKNNMNKAKKSGLPLDPVAYGNFIKKCNENKR